MQGILIGTAILWGLTALFVVPLTKLSLGRSMAVAGFKGGMDALPPEQKDHWARIAVRHYILWDIVVLGAAGVIGGLVGYWFIGVSMETKSWPGVIAFAAMSFIGLAIHGG